MATFIDTRDVLGDQQAVDALVSDDPTLKEFTESLLMNTRQYAFSANTCLEKIKIPGVRYLQDYMFSDNPSLKEVYIGFETENKVNLSSNAFGSLSSRFIIRVPDDLAEEYRSASNWSKYSYMIYGENEDALIWDESEITDSVGDIASKVANGTAATSYTLGQYKNIDLGSEGIHKFQIIGINKDELSESNGNAQLTWLSMDLLNTLREMNPGYISSDMTYGSVGGWDRSSMKTYLNETILPLFPAEWQGMIKTVKKSSSIINNNAEKERDSTSNDKLWIPSCREVGYSDAANYETVGPIYEFAFNSYNARVRKKSGTPIAWWLRSTVNPTGYQSVTTNGYMSSNSTNHTSIGIAVGFCT